MRLRVHHTLFAGVLAVIGLVVIVAVLLSGRGLRRELNGIYQDGLERQIELARALVESAPSSDPDSLARLITARIDNRVTIIDLDGVVLGDSYVDADRLPDVENHAGRPEVQGVVAGAPISFAQRTSATVGLPLLYGAVLSEVAGDTVILRVAAPMTDVDAAIGNVQRTIAVTGLFTLLVTLALVYPLSKVFTRPLVALADRAGHLAAGDSTSKVPPSRVAELDELADAFNRLAEELEERLSELRRERDEMQTLIECMAEGVVALTPDARILRMNRAARDVLGLDDVAPHASLTSVMIDPELRDYLEDSVKHEARSSELVIGGRHLLVASRVLDLGGAVTTLLDITELRHLEQVRRDFVANASHELKTPLTSIRGYAETLADDDPPEELRRRFIASIRSNTLRLQRLVDDLLDLSRLESGGWTPRSQEVPIVEVVAEAWDLVSSSTSQDRFFTIVGTARALGDRDGIFRVLRNLLENAVRHTEPEGKIRVEITTPALRRVVRVAVVDDGEGIPVEALPRVFERFYRADRSRARDFGGTGLGLAIAKHLVTSMGGEIEAESEAGEGTTVRFTLPLAG